MKKTFLTIVSVFFLMTGFTQTKDNNDQSASVEVHPEHPAEFPQGNKEWLKYLEHHLNISLGHKYLIIPKGEKNAKQTVKLSFEINPEGHTSNIIVENNEEVHPELAKEAIRVIANSPLWKPATQDGKAIPDKRKQKITFVNGSFP